jgi:hypothetical protein
VIWLRRTGRFGDRARIASRARVFLDRGKSDRPVPSSTCICPNSLIRSVGVRSLIGLALIGLALIGLALIGLALIGLALIGLALIGLVTA